MNYLELNYYLKYKVKNLSTGNKRKLSIILTLIQNPKFMIMDECTSGIDIRIRDKLKSIFL